MARHAAYEAQGRGIEFLQSALNEPTNEDGMVVGDEMRLRQIITNLTRLVALRIYFYFLGAYFVLATLASSHHLAGD